MQERDLTYFLAVASAGHVGRAAAELGLTQPALTKSIHRLERDLSARLLERTPKGVVVTDFGKHVLRHAKRVSIAMGDARREFADLRTGVSGYIRIGAGLALAQHILPTACARLLKLSPSVMIDVSVGTSRALIDDLRNAKLDLVLTGIPPEYETDLASEVIMEDHVIVIARKSHPLQRKRTITLHDLAQQRWALSKSGSLLTERLSQHFEKAGIAPPVPALQTESIATLLGIVTASDLLTFASWSTIRHAVLRTALHPLTGSNVIWRRELGVIYRQGGYLSSAAKRLVQLLKEAGAAEDGIDPRPSA